MLRYPSAVALMLLAACATTPQPPTLPEIVKVVVKEYVPIPDKLAQPCSVAKLKNRTVEAVVKAHNANVIALEACNRQLEGIRKLTK